MIIRPYAVDGRDRSDMGNRQRSVFEDVQQADVKRKRAMEL